MSEMTAFEALRAASRHIHLVGSAFMLHPETMTRAPEYGFTDPFAFYFAGRGGVLGDVDADVVTAAFGWFEPNVVRMMWEAGIAVKGARAASRDYADACARWGRDHLGGLEGIDHLADLTDRLLAATTISGLPLFAAWRAEPRVDDAPGRAMQNLHVLREWRAANHLVATTAVGLPPMEAILVRDKEPQATMFGWPAPYPDVAYLEPARDRAEALTDALVAPAWESGLNGAERAELVALVTEAHALAA